MAACPAPSTETIGTGYTVLYQTSRLHHVSGSAILLIARQPSFKVAQCSRYVMQCTVLFLCWCDSTLLTSQPRTQPVVVSIQQPVQDSGENGDIVFAVIRQRLSVTNHCPAGAKKMKDIQNVVQTLIYCHPEAPETGQSLYFQNNSFIY